MCLGQSKMTYLGCPSDPENDRLIDWLDSVSRPIGNISAMQRRTTIGEGGGGAGFIQTGHLSDSPNLKIHNASELHDFLNYHLITDVSAVNL